jgi:hypothetical protein
VQPVKQLLHIIAVHEVSTREPARPSRKKRILWTFSRSDPGCSSSHMVLGPQLTARAGYAAGCYLPSVELKASPSVTYSAHVTSEMHHAVQRVPSRWEVCLRGTPPQHEKTVNESAALHRSSMPLYTELQWQKGTVAKGEVTQQSTASTPTIAPVQPPTVIQRLKRCTKTQ